MKPKIIFFGSDKRSAIVLKSLQQDERFKIVKNLGDKPDVGVLASYGKILPAKTIKSLPYGILNIHPSLLPKYRGPSPVQAAILSGGRQTGVTIIKIDEKADHGPIASQFTETIRPNDTAESLYQRLFEKGAEVLKTILPAYLEGRIELKPQNHSQATYTKKLAREDGQINWQKSDRHNERFIRAMYSWPGAFARVKIQKYKDTKRLKILKAHLESDKLVLDQVQLAGKKPVTWKQFQEGYPSFALF